jgi:hypothetical protein
MARGGLDWEGIGAVYATFQAAGSVSAAMLASGVAAVEGKAVTIEADGKAGFGSAGDPLLGVINHYENDHYMTVQTGGYATVPGVSGALPDAGDFLVVDGLGGVKASAGAVGPARAVSKDSGDNTVVVLIC